MISKEENQNVKRLINSARKAVNELDTYCMDLRGNNGWYIQFNVIDIQKSLNYIELHSTKITQCK
jgi:hypothetical protein